ncbi:MAG: glycosyltransferase [Cellulosilyticum sp.]|nr:glycosyltransferase [Cellulosilyticum sp.]
MHPNYFSKKIAFKIPFNLPMTIGTSIIKRSNEWITDINWIKNRLNIFMSYTLKSLKNQTNQDFVAYILYHPPSEAMILNELKHYPKLPNHIQFIRAEDYSSRINPYIKNSEFYYEVELGSDDLYHKNFVQYLYDYVPKPTTRILICQDGYIFSSTENILAEYFNFSSFFNCWIYKSKDYMNNVRYSYEGYTGAIKLPHETIPWRAYINHSHSTNIAFSYTEEISTPWGENLAHVGTTFTDSVQKQAILDDFLGITVQDKIAIISINFDTPYKPLENNSPEAYLSQSWIDYRIDMFMKYTYTSLTYQTNSNFIALIHYNPTIELKLKTSLSRYPSLPNHIKFVSNTEQAIKNSIQGYNYFFLIHLNSDSMLHPSTIAKLFSLDTSTMRYACCQSNYILDLISHKIALYNHSLPEHFYVLIYTTTEYLSGYRIPINSNHLHSALAKTEYVTFSEPLFITIIHTKIMMNLLKRRFNYQAGKYLISSPTEQKNILSSFQLPHRLSL